MKLKRVVALLMALCIILTSMPIGALASEEIADGTYAVDEELSNTHEYVDGICIICGELHPSYVPLDSVEWVANQVIDGQLYRIRLNFKDGHWTYALGQNIDQFDTDFRETVLREYTQDIVLVDGTYYFLGVGDGGDFTYTTNEKNVYVNCEEYMHFTLERTTEDQLTVVESDSSAIREGVVLVYCGEHDWQSATCISPKMCTVCGEIEGEANGHSWDEGKETTAPGNNTACEKIYTCTICGQTRTEFSGIFGSNFSWVLDEDGLLVISGTGEMPNWDSGTASPWYNYRENIKILLVEEGVTTIGSSAFCDCSNLTSIILSDSVTNIGQYAFYNCSNLSVVFLRGNGIAWEGSNDEIASAERHWEVTETTYEGKLVYRCSSCSHYFSADGTRCCYDYSIIETAPTCTEEGGTTYICTCGRTYIADSDAVAPLGHTWDEDGLICLRCGEICDREGTCGDNLTWILDKGTLTISGTGDMWEWDNDAEVPWYVGKNQIQTVIIDNGVVSIGRYAFLSCDNLINVYLPDSLTTIGFAAFSKCSSITKITIPKNVTLIATGAFYECSNLCNIVFQGDAPHIANPTFEGVKTICYYPANNPTWTEDVKQNYGGIITWAPVSEVLFAEGKCGYNMTWMLDDEGNLTISGTGTMYKWTSSADVPWYNYRETIKNIVVEDGVTEIGAYAFYRCSNLVSVDLPDSLIKIGSKAFRYCSSLASVELPDGVSKIGRYTFANCSSLASIDLPDSITSIGDNAFRYCIRLASINLPNSVTSINYNAFYYCSRLKEITFAGNAPSVSGSAFYNVKATVYYPAGNSTWTDYRGNYGGSLTWIGRWMDPGGKCGKNLIWALDEDGLLTISGTGKMKNWNSASKIPWYAYREMIKTVVLEEGVSSIGNYAFYNCSSLTSIDLPESVTSIGSYAFENCSSLTEISFSGNVPSFGSNVFANVTATVYYPAGNSLWSSSVKKNYGGSLNWIEKWMNPSGKCGENLTWTLDEDGLLTISGTGKMDDWDSSTKVSWHGYRGVIKTVILEDGVGSVCKYAFYNCSNLVSIDIPDSVTSIGYEAFSCCSSLESIDLPDGITSIGEYAFYNCYNLASIDLPDSLTFIGEWAFSNCSSLASIDIPEGITSIRYGAFSGCSGLVSVDLPDSLRKISYSAFAGCSSLTSIDLPDGVTSIGGGAFTDCSSLTSITLPASLTYVDYALFTNCSSLTSIYLPAGITAISERAFFGCSSVTNINFAGDAPSIGYEAFYNVTADAYYPAGNDTWTHAAKQNYGGNLTWIAACPDHQYAEPAYIWSDDFVSCTATRSCINPQCEEVKREKVRASIETRAATCEEEGKTVYIVMFTSDVFTTQTKERSIPALGHDCSYTVTAEPDLANTGLITGICSRCSHQREVELPCLNVEDYAYEVTLEPTLTQLGAGVYTWKETAYGTFSFTVTLDKLAPELEELTVATNPDKTAYRLGEPLDTTGLVLQAVYSDGSIRTVTSGYRVSELDSSSPGEKTITVNYEGRSTTFQVTVQPMAETDPQILVSNSRGVLGHKVNVTISLKNNPGVTSMMLTVGYDPAVLQLQSVTDAGSLSNACHSDNYGSNPYTLTWDNDLARNDFVFDGELVTLTFLVAEDAEVGESAVTVSYAYDNYEIFNAAGENVWFATVNGSVNVIDVLLGDVNSDGKVNAYDRAYLARYLAKWSDYPASVINMDAADVNRDGMVNAHDRVYLARHLAKWSGYETLGT